MQRFDLSAIVPRPWKNGGGSTQEIACWPAGAGMDDFAWRISVATIDRDGAFSRFAGIDRQIMLLDGGGVRLRSQGTDVVVDHVLQQCGQPFAFAGEVPLDCTLLGRVSRDFNVMTRRGQWAAQVAVHEDVVPATASAAGLCMVLQGSWEDAQGQRFDAEQGFWWTAAASLGAWRPCTARARMVQVLLRQLESV